MPKVSIIIPVFNTERFLGQALESIAQQTYQDFEVVIIDDGSTDGSSAIAQSFSERDSQQFRYVRQDNQGLSVARNRGLEESRGEYIALLDADDVWFPHRLEVTVAALDQANPDVGLVHAATEHINEDGQVLRRPHRRAEELSGHLFKPLILRQVHISCPTVLFRKSCYKVAGGFDLKLSFLGCEDRDLWLRITKTYEVVFVNTIVAQYRILSNSMSRNAERMLKARLYVVDKNVPKSMWHWRLRAKALSRIYRDRGDEYLFKHEYKQAREFYLKALRKNPLSFWSGMNFIKACFGRKGSDV